MCFWDLHKTWVFLLSYKSFFCPQLSCEFAMNVTMVVCPTIRFAWCIIKKQLLSTVNISQWHCDLGKTSLWLCHFLVTVDYKCKTNGIFGKHCICNALNRIWFRLILFKTLFVQLFLELCCTYTMFYLQDKAKWIHCFSSYVQAGSNYTCLANIHIKSGRVMVLKAV